MTDAHFLMLLYRWCHLSHIPDCLQTYVAQIMLELTGLYAVQNVLCGMWGSDWGGVQDNRLMRRDAMLSGRNLQTFPGNFGRFLTNSLLSHPRLRQRPSFELFVPAAVQQDTNNNFSTLYNKKKRLYSCKGFFFLISLLCCHWEFIFFPM